MNPMIAVAKVGWLKHRSILLVLTALMLVGQAVFWSTWAIRPYENVLILSLLVTMLPFAMGAFLLSDWSTGPGGLTSSSSSEWLLRQPLSTPQIVIPMLVSTTLWITTTWLIVVLCVIVAFRSTSLPIAMPVLMTSGILFLAGGVSSLPQRRLRYRLLSMLVLLAVIIGLIGVQGSLFESHEPKSLGARLGPWAMFVSNAVSVIVYLAGAGLLYRGIAAARRETFRWQAITRPRECDPGNAADQVAANRAVANQDTRSFGLRFIGSPPKVWRGLFRFEQQRHRLTMLWSLTACLLFLLFVAVLFPPHPVGIVVGVAAAFTAAMLASQGVGSSVPSRSPRQMTPLLAVAPASSAKLAWVALASKLTTSSLVYSTILIPLGLWMLIPAKWARFSTLLEQGGGANLVAGWFALASICLLGRVIALDFCDRAGRISVALVMIGAGVAGYGTVTTILLRWFIKQRDYEAVVSSVQQWAETWPVLLMILCSLKLVAVAIVWGEAMYRGRYNFAAAGRVSLLWMLAFGLSCAAAWPLTRWEFHGVFLLSPINLAMLCVLALPLARVLAYPAAVSILRHQ
ncbi:hypothetical protein [Roseimaritima ulvae]|uniref:Uncharacterized protein n=1 Tax=Roseimaritima ulvae TaxID=980254 RepID=A0A5B9QWG0_9BACT|nr:hypothetical protein [Roseimaritima ulvae]QEG41715.1 hypothetical protein UC8_37410 [Roseimaritima ulvae]